MSQSSAPESTQSGVVPPHLDSFMNAPVGLLEMSADYSIARVNLRWTEITGCGQEMSPSEIWHDSIHPDDREAVSAEFFDSISENRPFLLDFRFLRPEGEAVWVSGRVNRVKDDSGKVLQHVAAIVDISEGVALKQQLSDSRHAADAFFEHSPDIVHLYATDGTSVRVNAALRARQQLPDHVHRLRNFNILSDPRMVDTPLISAFKTALAGEVGTTGPWQPEPSLYQDTAGTERRTTLEHTAFPVRDSQGNIVSVFICGRDVTEREEALLAVSRSEARMRAVLEQITEGIAIFSGNDLQFINPALCEIFGVTPEEAASADPTRGLVDQDFRKQMEKEVFEGNGRLYVVRARRKNGAEFDAALQFTLLREDSGWANATVVVARDISTYESARRALEASEANLAAFLANVDDMIYVFEQEEDGAMRATYANAATERLLGTPMLAMVGQTPRGILGESLGGQLDARLRGVAATRQAITYESDSGPHSRKLTFSTNLNPIVDERTGRLRIIGSARDITEMREAQRVAQDHARLQSLSVLAAGIAHDFNNLLQAMLIGVDLASAQAPAGWEGIEILNDIRSSAKQAGVLAQQMLSFSGGRPARRMPIDLAELCKAAAVSVKLGSVSIQVEIDEQDRLATFGDSQQLQQALNAIVANAEEACEATGGSVVVSLGRIQATKEMLARAAVRDDMPPGEYAMFRVSDTGAGMDADVQHQMFEPFYSTKFTGRGLGLAATLGIIRGHSGTILVESAPGRGTTITVLLPIHAGDA